MVVSKPKMSDSVKLQELEAQACNSAEVNGSARTGLPRACAAARIHHPFPAQRHSYPPASPCTIEQIEEPSHFIRLVTMTNVLSPYTDTNLVLPCNAFNHSSRCLTHDYKMSSKQS